MLHESNIIYILFNSCNTAANSLFRMFLNKITDIKKAGLLRLVTVYIFTLSLHQQRNNIFPLYI